MINSKLVILSKSPISETTSVCDKMKVISFITLSFFITCAECAKILLIFPMASPSHFILGFQLAKGLINNGHEVTVISPYPQKNPIKNYRDISVEENIEFFEDLRKRLFDIDSSTIFEKVTTIFRLGNNMTEETFKNERVQKFLKSGEHFDAVVLENFLNDAQFGIAHLVDAPLILLSTQGSNGLNNHLFANPAPSSYVPVVGGDFSKHMNFWQRIKNLSLNLLGEALLHFYYLPRQRKIFKKYVSQDLEFDDILYNASLMLTNSHVSVNDAVPHVPNIIEIGGFHVDPLRKKLPEDLQQFLDNAKNGVILFSMGSNLKSSDLKPEVRRGILTAFSKIPQKILWKFEEDLPEAPPNVKIMKWIPQQDVLAHPNLKTFISHGGLLSTIEAVYFGVPIIGIPVFGDQLINIAAAVANGYAIGIPLTQLSEETLSRALEDILNNPRYAETVKKRSQAMHDRPLKPIDEGVFWIEYVIRHKGAPYLRSAGLDLYWYQRSMIDTILVLTIITIVIFVIFYIIIRWLLGFLCGGKNVHSVSVGKKKV